MTRPRHVFLVRDRAPISPLELPAADTQLLGGTLHEEMLRRFAAAGLAAERVDSLDEAFARAAQTPAGALVTLDSVAASRSVIRHLVAAAAKDARPALAAALPEARATKVLAAVSGLDPATVGGTPAFTAPLFAVKPGSAAGRPAAEPVLLPFKELEWKFPTPIGMLGRAEEPFGATDTYLIRVEHWSHILRLNLQAQIASWFERWQSPLGKLWYLWRALSAFPWRGGRVGGNIHRIHPKAKVHHTATVELSVIDEGATVGANAVVKSSYIGKNAHVDDAAIVNASVLGEGAFIANQSGIFSCVLFPGAFAAQQKMQFSVLGARSVAFTGSYFYDLNFDRNVHVVHRGKLVDAGSRFLSVCLGPYARIGGGIWVASGREIPARALVVQPPDRVAHKLDPAVAQAAMTTVADKALVALGPLPSNVPDDEQPPRVLAASGKKPAE